MTNNEGSELYPTPPLPWPTRSVSPAAQRASERLEQQIAAHGPVACQTTDPEAWYPDTGQPSALVVQLCHDCPVNGACLDYSLAADERYGIWGGTTPTQRTAIREDHP